MVGHMSEGNVTCQKIHTAEAHKPLPDGRPATSPPQRSDLFQASPVKRARTVEHDRRG